MKIQSNWWCAACGGHYDWREASRVLTVHAFGRSERHALLEWEHATS